MEITRKPSKTGAVGSLTAAAVATAALATVSTSAAAIAGLGIILAAAAMVRGERGLLLGATGVLGLGMLFGGFAGGGPAALLTAGVGVVLTWDIGEHAIGIGEQLGRETEAKRIETVHTVAGIVVGAVGVTISLGVYQAATGGQPIVALVFLLIGAVALVSALRE